MDIHKIAIIIPAYNEAKTVVKIIEQCSVFGVVIIVNDNSDDDTQSKAESAGAIVVNHKQNLGYDGALNSGFKKANELDCDFMITLDADGQHEPKLIKLFINQLDIGFDLVLGVRDKLPRVAEIIFALYAKYRFNISDPCCGLKGYSSRLYRKKKYFNSYNSIGTELAFFGVKNNYKYIEIPFKVKNRLDLPRFGNSIKANIKILKSMFISILKKS